MQAQLADASHSNLQAPNITLQQVDANTVVHRLPRHSSDLHTVGGAKEVRAIVRQGCSCCIQPQPRLQCCLLTVQEAQWMLDQGITADTNCASRAIGYRQALLALQHWQAHPADATPQQLVSN